MVAKSPEVLGGGLGLDLAVFLGPLPICPPFLSLFGWLIIHLSIMVGVSPWLSWSLLSLKSLTWGSHQLLGV